MKLRWHQRNAAKQNFAKQIRGARRFFSREKQVFLVDSSLKFLRFPRKSKNQLNTSLYKTMKCSAKRTALRKASHMRYNWRYKYLSMLPDQNVMMLLSLMERCPTEFHQGIVFYCPNLIAVAPLQLQIKRFVKATWLWGTLFFYKNNFIRTKVLILAKKFKNKLRTKQGLLFHRS